jgi:hypothetical protein
MFPHASRRARRELIAVFDFLVIEPVARVTFLAEISLREGPRVEVCQARAERRAVLCRDCRSANRRKIVPTVATASLFVRTAR